MTFAVEGPVWIIGLGNGDPNCHEAEKGNSRSLFNGLAQVILQADEAVGEAVLTATASGLKPFRLTIPVSRANCLPFVQPEDPPMTLGSWSASPLSLERPDVTCVIADNDMNSWQPITIGRGRSIKLNKARYVMVRTTFVPYVEYREGGGALVFKNLAGKAEIWLNGKLLGKKDELQEKDFKVDFPSTKGICDLRVLLQAVPNAYVGLKGSVNLQGK